MSFVQPSQHSEANVDKMQFPLDDGDTSKLRNRWGDSRER